MVACSCYQPLYTRFQLLKCSLVEPIFCTMWSCVQTWTFLVLLPDWRCVQSSILTIPCWASLICDGLFLLPTLVYAFPNSKLFFNEQSRNCTLVFLSRINLVQEWIWWSCVQRFLYCFFFSPKYASVFLSWTSGPVVACFYYQHLYTRCQTPNCSSIEQSRSCTLAFPSWTFLVQSEFYETASKDFYTVSSSVQICLSVPQLN